MGNGVSGLVSDSSRCFFSICPDGGSLGQHQCYSQRWQASLSPPCSVSSSAHWAQNPKDKGVTADTFEKSRWNDCDFHFFVGNLFCSFCLCFINNFLSLLTLASFSPFLYLWNLEISPIYVCMFSILPCHCVLKYSFLLFYFPYQSPLSVLSILLLRTWTELFGNSFNF